MELYFVYMWYMFRLFLWIRRGHDVLHFNVIFSLQWRKKERMVRKGNRKKVMLRRKEI